MDTGIYIDYDNLYLSLRDYYGAYTSTDVIKKILDGEMSKENTIRLIKAFCDFEQSYEEISQLQKNLVELRHITSVGSGKNNASDIALSIDVIKSLYNSSGFDRYIIVSSDSDMLPLLLELRYSGRNVVLYYLESNINDKYLNMLCSNSNIEVISIEKILGIEVYKEKDIENISEEDIQKYLKTIEEIIKELRSRYGEDKASISFNAIRKGLTENHIELESEDSTKLIYKLEKDGFIFKEEKDFYFSNDDEEGEIKRLTTWDISSK